MGQKAGKILERVARESMLKCVSRLSRLSTGKWSVGSVAVTTRSMSEAARERAGNAQRVGAAVYFDVKGDYPFSAMVVFSPDDAETLSRAFLGFSFSRLPKLSQAHELLLSEMGNIILNSLAGSLSAALNRQFLPSVPKCVQGEVPSLLEALWASLDRPGRHGVITVSLDLDCDGSEAAAEVIAVIPEELEAALEASPDAG